MKAADEIVLHDQLKQLRLPVVKKVYEETARQAKQKGVSYPLYLSQVLGEEVEHREKNLIQRRLKEAKFPQFKALENSDVNKWQGVDARDIQAYAQGQFIEKCENLILIGKHGTGKSHFAIAIGIEACRRAKRVRFVTASALVNALVEARDEKNLQNMLKRLFKVDLLIIDELGYLPIDRAAGQLLFQVISDRYEQGSTLITTNLNFPQWNDIFDDANLTAALLDRLTHHGHIHVFDWGSIRFEERLKRSPNKP